MIIRTLKAIADTVKSKFIWIRVRREWYRRNSHNHCSIKKIFPIDQVSIGNGTYGMIDPYFYGQPGEFLTIGNYCSIAEGTKFVFGDHNYHRISTFPFRAIYSKESEKNPVKGAIVIEDDVWIGMDCHILSGVTIHRGAVIGAGTVVAKDVPPYAIYAGGEIKGYRFDKEVIAKLEGFDYSKLNTRIILNNLDFFENTDFDEIKKSELFEEMNSDKNM